MKINFPKSLDLKNNITIRELTIDDLKMVNQWHNSSELYRFLVGTCHYPSEETDLEWINAGLKKANLYRGVVSNSFKPIGIVYLTREPFDTLTFEIFIGDESERGRGIGTIVCSSIVKNVFSYKEYNKIVLSVLAKNKRAIALYKKCGFNIVSKNKTIKDNKTEIIYNMSILRSNYENKHN